MKPYIFLFLLIANLGLMFYGLAFFWICLINQAYLAGLVDMLATALAFVAGFASYEAFEDAI